MKTERSVVEGERDERETRGAKRRIKRMNGTQERGEQQTKKEGTGRRGAPGYA